MVTLQKLAQYKELLDRDISEYSNKLLSDWGGQYTDYSKEALAAYCAVLSRGGKRLRGALVMTAYEMFGGTDTKMILQAARVIEMVHAYVLIIDDIADHADIRRGGPSAHKAVERYHSEQKLHGDSAHFGISIAMHAAVAGCHLALDELGRLPVDNGVKIKAMNNLNQCLLVTVNGQFNDLFNEALQDVSEEQVKNVLTWKTAYYSFLNPLQLGAILGKADQSDLDRLTDYSMNAGLSFQLIDDVLGTFGNEFESGKSAQDDLKEGKITLLIARTLTHAGPDQKRRILSVLGNRELSLQDYHECKTIIRDTGALDYVTQLAQRCAAKGARSLDEAPDHWRGENIEFLKGLAAYITSRSS